MDTKFYYKCKSVEEEASLSFYSGVIPYVLGDLRIFPDKSEVEEIAEAFGIELIPVNAGRVFFIDGAAYRLAYISEYGERYPVLLNAEIELVEDEFGFWAPFDAPKVKIAFGEGRGGWLYNKNENVVKSIADWAIEWQQELRQLTKELKNA